MIVFSKITCRADTTTYVYSGLVSGTPRSYDDLAGWTGFEAFLQECNGDSKVTIDVEVYGYGEDDGFGKFDASVEEVAYMLMRCNRDERFLANRCTKLDEYKITLNWNPDELYCDGDLV